MKERPILFSAPMVRAILDGSKTQTRRVVKQAVGPSLSVGIENDPGVAELSWLHGAGPGYPVEETIKRVPCPYGQPGDRLWVRETFHHEPADYCWEASVSIPSRPAHTTYRADFPGDTTGFGWQPSIHMPRSLSRITLEVTGVHVERLNDCSEADARAEGVEVLPEAGFRIYHPEMGKIMFAEDAVTSYRSLWNSINGPGSWDMNPWVWVVEFRRIEP